MKPVKANKSDAKEILELQKIAYQSEARIYDDFRIPPLTQSLTEIENEFDNNVFLKIIIDDSIIASVRAYQKDNTCFIGRLIVHPDYQNQGIGKMLMSEIEKRFSAAERFELFTGSKSTKNIYLYEKLGYSIFKTERLSDAVQLVFMEKYNNP